VSGGVRGVRGCKGCQGRSGGVREVKWCQGAGVTILIPDFPFIRTRHCRLSNGAARGKMSGAKIVRIESLNIRISKTNH